MKKGVAPKLRWGRFRLQVIGPLLASPAASGELQAKLRELSERVYRHPLDPEMSMLLGFSTIERWYYQAKDAADPIVALSRKTRSDAGRREALSEALFGVLAAQYASYPRWTVQLHYDNLAAEVAEKPQLGTLPSYQSVRRRMREKGWLRRCEPANPTEGQRRAALRRDAAEFLACYFVALEKGLSPGAPDFHTEFPPANLIESDEGIRATQDHHSRVQIWASDGIPLQPPLGARAPKRNGGRLLPCQVADAVKRQRRIRTLVDDDGAVMPPDFVV